MLAQDPNFDFFKALSFRVLSRSDCRKTIVIDIVDCFLFYLAPPGLQAHGFGADADASNYRLAHRGPA